MFFKPGTVTLLDANKTAENLYGYSRQELKDQGLSSLCGQENYPRFCSFISTIGDRAMANLDNVTHFRKDGEEINVSVRCKLINIQGVQVVYCTFRDITLRVRMEAEAQYIQAKLIQANKMTSLGLLVSGVAHEINNPNNFILANSQLLDLAWQDALKVLREYYRDHGDFKIGGIPFSAFDEQSRHLFAGITDGSRRINEIVNNLKEYVRAGAVPLEQEVSINQVVTSAINILHYELIKHTDRFHLILGEDLPPIRGISQQLVQVVTNLVINACQSITDKKCGIWVTTSFDKSADQVLITVRDEGQGIPENLRGRIMDPFFTTKLDSGGTGLGLFINQSIINEHGGSLEFTSEPGRETVFTVKIPAARPASKEHSS
jgi:PAS domain S-box-containing protein